MKISLSSRFFKIPFWEFIADLRIYLNHEMCLLSYRPFRYYHTDKYSLKTNTSENVCKCNLKKKFVIYKAVSISWNHHHKHNLVHIISTTQNCELTSNVWKFYKSFVFRSTEISKYFFVNICFRGFIFETKTWGAYECHETTLLFHSSLLLLTVYIRLLNFNPRRSIPYISCSLWVILVDL